MKKICFSFNHFQYSDGIARSAISMANYLSQRKDIEVTLRPIFKIQKEAMNVLNKNIKIKPVLGFYFNGELFLINFGMIGYLVKISMI